MKYVGVFLIFGLFIDVRNKTKAIQADKYGRINMAWPKHVI